MEGRSAHAINLETAVGRARVGRHGVGWQGETTLLAAASKEEQRGQRTPGRLNRVRSAFTQMVSAFVAKKVSVQGLFQRKMSGQLPFLGSIPPGFWDQVGGDPVRLVDIGCGVGAVLGHVCRSLSLMGRKVRGIGIDIADEALAHAR